VKVNNELVATGCLAKWESGKYILSSIATKESERGKGYGEKITRGLVALAGKEGIDEVYLAVSAKNPGAQRVYEKVGFRSLGKFHTFEREKKSKKYNATQYKEGVDQEIDAPMSLGSTHALVHQQHSKLCLGLDLPSHS
jgi:ribosomal protein S18 acetylase RimI-like enzyme